METRVCRWCSQNLPIAEFRRRSRSSEDRRTECNGCHRDHESLRRSARNADDRKRILTRFWRETERARSEAQMFALVASLIASLGGVEKTVATWSAAMTAAEARLPGSRTALAGFRAIMSLITAAEQLKDPPEPDDWDPLYDPVTHSKA